ncbi:MAG: exopolysaccharide biosynthesis polyprenyl glycosylphosphotransferase [Lachnospiraceae bacterium]|jgi:exopolysaccharide biosynthesis polyprenyl glycosylphosphotransferase|nr:exopolysaccharide biosynthesis polyprenyl glycosylphosphotransferase [Lachnospiraceae bacterium]
MKQINPINHKKHLESVKRFINLLMAIVCLGLEIAIFTYHWIVHFYTSLVEQIHFFFWGYILEISIYAVILFLVSKMYGGLRIGYYKNSETIFSKIFATILANIVIYFQLSLMANELFILRFFIEMTILQIITDILWILISTKIYQKFFPPRKLFLVHGNRFTESICDKFDSRKDKYRVVTVVNSNVGIDLICDQISREYQQGTCDAVVIWDTTIDERNQLLKFCYARSIRFYTTPKISDVILLGAEELHLFDTPILLTREYRLTMEQRFIKRFIDITVSCILLILTSPIMLITAICIKIHDGGSVLYKQTRCTRDEKHFLILKFRSMQLDAEKDGVARLSPKNDVRITPIGRFIRKVRIDELPQLINILKGEMSFVGPRPERPEIIAENVKSMPEFTYRMKVKAGLAGYAQIYGKYNTDPYDKLRLDLRYIEKYSILLDLKLMLLTLKILFSSDSTEGVDTQQLTEFANEYQKKRPSS